mmetsp:Transcript_15714/g.25076  ORF Transcript_15714/g.25076 Transcript_15714/m.25076 type:complete len:85 (-) Transcript_15714:160-414(-)
MAAMHSYQQRAKFSCETLLVMPAIRANLMAPSKVAASVASALQLLGSRLASRYETSTLVRPFDRRELRKRSLKPPGLDTGSPLT